jgi:hypothetical protein
MRFSIRNEFHTIFCNQVKFGTVNKFEEYKFLCSRFTGNDMIEDYCRMQYTLNDMRVLFFFLY